MAKGMAESMGASMAEGFPSRNLSGNNDGFVRISIYS